MAPSADMAVLLTFTFENQDLKPTWEKFKKNWVDAKRQSTRQENKHKKLMVNLNYDVDTANGTETQKQMQARLKKAKDAFKICNDTLEKKTSIYW